MVELVVAHIETLEASLRVHSLELVVPRDSRLLRAVQIDPDEATLVDVHVDSVQRIIILVESVHLIEARGLGEVSIESIGPP